jgi:AbrB family looped-hinge helix DNA binding protein
VDSAGRVLIPARVRQRHGLQPGSVVIVNDTATGGISLTPQRSAVRAAQAYFSKLRRGDELWSEELIQERRDSTGAQGGRTALNADAAWLAATGKSSPPLSVGLIRPPRRRA